MCALYFTGVSLCFAEFHLILCGLDSVLARRWINGMLVSWPCLCRLQYHALFLWTLNFALLKGQLRRCHLILWIFLLQSMSPNYEKSFIKMVTTVLIIDIFLCLKKGSYSQRCNYFITINHVFCKKNRSVFLLWNCIITGLKVAMWNIIIRKNALPWAYWSMTAHCLPSYP